MFYEFKQNNSGGSYDINLEDGINIFVIIEADNARQANDIAKYDIGLYFNGCDDGIDCPCCGDRWQPCDESDGYDSPKLYSQNIDEFYEDGLYDKGSVSIHYRLGDVRLVKTV